MNITNYSIDKCKYRIDKLDKVVYLINKGSLGNVNTQSYYIDGGAQATVIRCNSVSLSETTNLDERYRFTHTLNFQVDGYMTLDDFNERYYTVVKDMNGVYYVVNPEFKMKVTYTYTLDSTGEHTDFSLSTISNSPLLRVDNFAPWATANFTSGDTMYKWVNVTPTSDRNSYICDFAEDDFVCKPYSLCSIDTIMLNETAYSTYANGFAHYTNDGFKQVDYIKNSATFTETFNGENIVHQLKFTTPYDNSSWHNLLLDFMDNKYCTIITTKCGKSIACGFQHGLMPSYNITGSNSENDKIEITLADLHDQGRLIYRTSTIGTSGQTATTWIWVENEYECVDNYTAKHLLREIYDIYGNSMDLYECLSGYTSQYSYLGDKLIGEFEDTQSIYFENNKGCYDTECSLRTTLSDMTFNDRGTKGFNVYCNQSSWSASSTSNNIVIHPTSGEAGVEYTISVTNNIIPSSAFGQTHTITLTFCDEYTQQYSVTVKKVPVTDYFPLGDTYNLSLKSQTLTIPCTTCITDALSDEEFAKVIQYQDGCIVMQIEKNVGCSGRTATIDVALCNGIIIQLNIIQSGNDCSSPLVYAEYLGGETYTVPCSQSEYISTTIIEAETAPRANTMTSCTIGNCSQAIAPYSFANCTKLTSLEIGSGTTVIDYKAFKYCTMLDSITIHAAPPYLAPEALPNTLEHIYVECEYVPQYKAEWSNYASIIEPIEDSCPEYNRTTSGTPYCQGYDKYVDVYYQVSFDSGETWTTISTATTLMERNSTDCGYVPPEPINYLKQPFTLNAIESSSFKFNPKNSMTFASGLLEYSLDSGSTWVVMTDSNTPIIQAGNKIMFRGECVSTFEGIGTFSSSGKYSVEGNTMSLLYRNNFSGQTSLNNKTLTKLFVNSTNLISAENMKLPATTLVQECYSQMFYNCANLEIAPELPAATLVNICYYQMFRNCYKLNKITCLATDISAHNCTSYWVHNVASSGTFTKAASMSSWTSGASGTPTNWTITNA